MVKADKAHLGPPPGGHQYTRDGFVGEGCFAVRPHDIYEYTSVSGSHAPHRLALTEIETADMEDAEALPTVIANSRSGSSISVSRRSKPMPYVFRNTECDELHFVQHGEMEFDTDFGSISASPGDFVRLGRAVTYQVTPRSSNTLRVIIETAESIELRPPAPAGMVNFGRDVGYPKIKAGMPNGETQLWLKSFDGITRYVVPNNPLCCTAILDGKAPVWKLNLQAIAPIAYPNAGGPPAPFAQVESTDMMLFTLSSRPPAARPPQHHNADYDELIFYFTGPGKYGDISEPGTLAWTPKGVTHWGPLEDVPEGYWAWLLESRGTVRLTEAGLGISQPMETGEFGVHPQASKPSQVVSSG